jgi:uncharacterized protein
VNAEKLTETDDDIKLYTTPSGPVVIESRIKKKIMRLLTERDYSFDELVKETNKAKSTVSVHIRDLEASGLISSRPYPGDNRRRLISLSSHEIGSLTNRDRKVAEINNQADMDNLPFTSGDIASFFRWAVRLFRVEAMALGVNIDPVLSKCGYKIGLVLSSLVSHPDLSVLIMNLNQFWKTYGLGSIELKEIDPIILTVRGCFECEDLPVTGHSACSFDVGVLSAIFSLHLNSPVIINEDECYSSGYDHCKFVITKLKA